MTIPPASKIPVPNPTSEPMTELESERQRRHILWMNSVSASRAALRDTISINDKTIFTPNGVIYPKTGLTHITDEDYIRRVEAYAERYSFSHLDMVRDVYISTENTKIEQSVNRRYKSKSGSIPTSASSKQ